MKKRVLVFVAVVLLAMTLVPVINLIELGTAQNKEGKKWWSRSVLYNLDFALPYLARLFYPLGISTDPNQVVIGKNDWLFLGDQYGETITVSRRGATAEDAEAARKIGLATKSWEQWLKLKGVRLYQVMLAPDKGTIYPEFLPDWAQPATDSATNTLLAGVSQGLYVDTRPALIAAKSQFSEPLYHQTNTHWNSLGAWVAFRAFARAVDRKEGGLRWLSDQQVRILRVYEGPGGDLAPFLRMVGMLRDSYVVIEIVSDRPIETEQYDFETGHLTASGGNPHIGAPGHPLLVKSKNALNQKRVLWLRDSFGTAIAPYMAATFTETLQLHYGATNPAIFARLVDTYKPDYVFITVVERDARGGWFTNPPPMPAITAMVPAAPASELQPSTAEQISQKRLGAPASCNLEIIDSARFTAEPFKVARKSVRVIGWFLPELSKKTGVPASLRILDEAGTTGWEAKLENWSPRPNVIAAMHGVDAGNAGFSQALDLSSLAPGKYKLSVVFSDSGTQYVCDNGRVLDVQ